MTQPKPEAPLYLEDLMARISGSERVIVETAARQVIYRGYAANFHCAGIRAGRRVKSVSIGMETYRAIDKMWDWCKSDRLPELVPFESIPEFQTGELKHILYQRIQLVSDFE